MRNADALDHPLGKFAQLKPPLAGDVSKAADVLENSFRRLKVDRIDLMQIYKESEEPLLAELDLLHEARARGYDFPLLEKPLYPSKLLAKVKEVAARSHAPLILNVDDDDALRHAVTQFLARAGLRTIEAATGTEAIRLAASKAPDLILLDLNLPDVDGFEVCRMLKSAPITKGIPIVHLTSTFCDEEARAFSMRVGADVYLTHPILAEDLLTHVNRLLNAGSRSADRDPLAA